MTYVFKAYLLSPFVRQVRRPFLTATRRDDLLYLRELVETGRLTPVVDRTYPLREVPEELDYMGEGHVRGKLVIAVQDGR